MHTAFRGAPFGDSHSPRVRICAVSCAGDCPLTPNCATQYSKLGGEKDATPLQTKLDKMAARIGQIGTVVAILVFMALSGRYVWTRWIRPDCPGAQAAFGIRDVQAILNSFIISITIVVVAIPEGLPLAVTISLAYSMRKMLKDKNLVRHLIACETMGGATNICSDKTGTLTENRMTVTEGFFGGAHHDDVPSAAVLGAELTALIAQVAAVDSTAFLDRSDAAKGAVAVGSKTECALLVLAEKLGADYAALRHAHVALHLVPFSSARKRMSTVVAAPLGRRVLVKGASEIVLAACTQMVDAEGSVVPLGEAEKRAIVESEINHMAGKGLRTLALAYRDSADVEGVAVAAEAKPPTVDGADLTLLCIVGIQDPLRPSVFRAVQQCQQAGITVRMVTGDNVLTAQRFVLYPTLSCVCCF